MTKPFTTPFAENGDVMFIPETAQPDGSVSYETGFGPDYSADPLEANAKPVPRAGHNELFNQITGSIGDIQRQGAADWYPEFAADGGYPKNAIVWLDGDRWKSQIDANATRPNIDEIAWLPSAKFEGGGGGGGGDFGLTGPTTIAVGGSFKYKISPYSSFMTYAVSATNGTATISGDTITLTIAPGETANVTDLTVIRSDGARNDFRIAIGAQSIAKPSMLSPASGSVDVPLGPLLTASAFMTYPDGADTHLNTDWRIRTMAGAVVWQSLENAVNKTNIQVPDNTLPLNTQLQADVRYRGATIPVSAWSDAVTFTTTNQSILTPTITAPLNGATGIGATPTFTATAFATNPLGADTHASSDWRLKNSAGDVIWSSVANAISKTSITLPTGVLAVSSQYTMEVRYNGSVLQPSQWSPVVSFTTASTFAYEKYIAIGGGSSPFVNIYGQDIDSLIKLANPSPLLTGYVISCSFSGNGRYLALAHNNAPFVTVYKRNGDLFERIAPPAIGASPQRVVFSPDSTLLAVTIGSTLYLYRLDGDVFTRINNSVFSPIPELPSDAYFSADSQTLFLVTVGTRLSVYARSGYTFTRTAQINLFGSNAKLAASFDGSYLAAVNSGTEGGVQHLFKRSGADFTPLRLLSGLGAVSQACFSRDGVFVAFSSTAAPYIFIYKRSGDTFTKLANPATLPTGEASGVAFSQDGLYLFVSLRASPYIFIYKRSGDTFTKLANPATFPTGDSLCIDVYPKNFGPLV